MAMKSIAFLLLWTGVAASLAWLGMDRLKAARATGKFEYLWHGIGQENWPLLFKLLKAFLTVWTAAACFMTVIGGVWLIWALAQKVR